MLKLLISLTFIAPFNYVQAQKNDTTVTPAPNIVFQHSLDNNVAPNFYKGKILILDFWATWCAPCIAGFPHFNALSKKYSSNDVVFASISNEPLSTVKTFFNRTKKQLNAIKLIDTTQATMKAYSVGSFPYCIIIDKNNVIRWSGNTADLTDSLIDQTIHNKAYAKPPAAAQLVKTTNKPITSRPLFTFNVAIADTSKLSSPSGPSYLRDKYNVFTVFSDHNEPLANIIEVISGRSKTRFITNNNIKIQRRIDLDYKIGSDTSRFKNYNNIVSNGRGNNFAISLLGEALKFNAKVISQKQNHYELIIADTAKLHSFKSMTTHHSGYDYDHYPRFEDIGYNLKDITTHLESNVKTIITTNINDNNIYDVSLDISSIDALNKSLQFHGLKLIQVTNEVQMLEINFY